MAKYFVLYALLIQILFLLATTSDCQRVDRTKTQTHLEKSGWRTIDTSSLEGGDDLSHAEDGEGDDDEEVADIRRNETNRSTSAKTITTVSPKSKKLVEWDDDELNDLRDSKDSMPFFISFQDSKKISKQDPLGPNKIKASNYYRQQNERRRVQNRFKSGAAKFSRLVYHGQVKANNTLRVIDGIKLYINTHKPVKINRNKINNDDDDQRASISKIPTNSNHHKTSLWFSSGEEPREEPSSLNSHWAATGSPLTNKMKMKSSVGEAPKQQEEQSAKSNWKPIAATDSRDRRSKKKASEKKLMVEHSAAAEKPIKVGGEGGNSKWKPIVAAASGSKQSQKDSFRLLNSQQRSSIEEPFDDDCIITVRGTDFDKRHTKHRDNLREPKSIDGDDDETATTKSLVENRWTPVETTTLDSGELTNSESITTTTTVATPLSDQSTTTNGTAGQQSVESAQKSASDINYIYSSHPVATQSVGQPSNGYYSNYVMQPQQPPSELPLPQPHPQQPVVPSVPITAPIIDTTSGQMPEMVGDREPDTVPLPVVGSSGAVGGDYSVPQTSAAAVQPSPALPSRPSGGYGSYGGYGNSYDSHGYYAPAPARVPVAQPQQQPTRQAPAQHVVRQEHHYHYYNHQHQSPDRQLSQQQPQVQQQVIRELQPLFISQPAIVQQQQQQSTTAAPTLAPTQIIREIIKEVPVQTMALPPPLPQPIARIMLPPPIPIPVPIPLPTREVGGPDTNGHVSYTPTASAQRIIRQLSNSIPTVRLQVPQIRIPMPALQLPVRLAPTNPAPITRQTGSFVIPPVPQKTTTFLTETQAMPTHTTIMQTTQFTPATRTTVYTTEHQAPQTLAAPTGYKAKK